MPKVPAVMEGPDLGRSKGVSYLLAAQDYGQIKKKYSEEDVQIINSTTAVKFILPQNNKNTVDTMIGMVGKTTIRRATHSYTEGAHKEASPFKWNRNDTAEETDFLRPADISGMRPGTHLLIVQNFTNRPMKLRTDNFYANKALRAKVHSRGKGPVATQVLPDSLRLEREAENDRFMRRREADRAFRLTLAAEGVVAANGIDDMP